jgi:phage/plasmid-like protein (TIGR03299 family)
MPANVESMFYTGATPWHGLGEKLEDAPTISEAIEASGLDWEVGTKDLVTKDGYDVPARATYRKTDNTILGVVGPRYVPLQNKDAFNWFQPFIDAGECSLHTGGSLSDGQKVWALAQLNRDPSEIVKGDEVQKFILLSNSHDGTTAIRVGYTPIRGVCVNTLAFAHQNGVSKLLRIRHTKSAAANLDNVRDIMDNINGQFEATAEQFRFLAGRNFNQVDVRKYVKTLLNVEKTADEDLKTRTKNILDDVLATIEGPKQSMPGVKGTWWAAYNGFNEYLNYTKGRNTNNRMESLWFGQNGAANNRALALATEYANSL